MSVDPLTKDYAYLTPYQFANNTPIAAVDLDGLESKISIIVNENTESKIDVLRSNDLTQSMIFRGIGADASYKYKVLSQKYGSINIGFTSVQEWAYNKAKRVNINKLADRLFKHFLIGQGKTYKLIQSEMKAVRPYHFELYGTAFPKSDGSKNDVSFNSRTKNLNSIPLAKFENALNALSVGESANFSTTITAGAQSNGTLGQFAIDFEGKLTKTSKTTYSFDGTGTFRDTYNFDIRLLDLTGLRSKSGSSKVLKARAYQLVTGNGVDFEITSEKFKFKRENEKIKKIN